MKILAEKARLYVDLLDEYDNLILDCLHPEFDPVAKEILARLCNCSTFTIKGKDASTLIMAVLYRIFLDNKVFEDKEITQSTFFKWGHTTKPTMQKWSKQLELWGIEAKHLSVKRTQFQIPALDFVAFMERLKLEIDHYDANYEAIELLREMMDLPPSQDQSTLDQTTLMAILERYPETEAGYSGVMQEVDSIIEAHQLQLENQIAIAQQDANYDLWYHWPARSYFRLLFDLVDFHKAIGYLDLALEYGQMLLSVLKNDQLGVRELMIPLVIQLRETEKAEQIFQQFKEDDSSAMLYNRALFLLQQKSPKAEAALKKAFLSNTHIPEYLFGIRNMPFEGDLLPERFAPGDETEAILYCYNAQEAWHTVPSALSTLKKFRKQQLQETKIVAFRPRR